MDAAGSCAAAAAAASGSDVHAGSSAAAGGCTDIGRDSCLSFGDDGGGCAAGRCRFMVSRLPGLRLEAGASAGMVGTPRPPVAPSPVVMAPATALSPGQRHKHELCRTCTCACTCRSRKGMTKLVVPLSRLRGARCARVRSYCHSLIRTMRGRVCQKTIRPLRACT